MTRAHWVILGALAAVALLLFFALDGGRAHTDDRAEGADRGTRDGAGAERAAGVPSAPLGGDPEHGALSIAVHPPGEADVEVRGPRSWAGRTDADGHAFVRDLLPGEYAVFARRGDRVAARDVALAGRASITLDLRTATPLRGHVYDTKGEPIAGARVEAIDGSDRERGVARWGAQWIDVIDRFPVRASATTDEGGAYTLLLPAPGRYRITASAAGYAGETEEARPYRSGTEIVDFRLGPGATVAGRVLDTDGTACEGVLVVLEISHVGRRDFRFARSAADGGFRFPVSPTAMCSLRAYEEGYPPQAYGIVHAPVEDLVVRLERGVRAVAQLVFADAGRSPAPGVEGMIRGRGWACTAVSDERGRIEFHRMPTLRGARRTFSLALAGGGCLPLLETNVVSEPVDGVADLGEIELERGAVVRGFVRDASSGAAIEGAVVRWWGGAAQMLAHAAAVHATTDADGRYELVGVPSGIVAILAVKEGYACNADRRELFRRQRDKTALLLAPGQLALDHDVTLARSAPLTGTVVDAAGDPVAGARVAAPYAAYSEFGADGRIESVTGADGRFTILGYAAGDEVELDANHPLHGSVTAAKAVVGEEAEIRLPGAARVTGRVLDPEGRPLAHAAVEARDPERTAAIDPQAERSWTGADGRFVVSGVPRLARILRIDHPGYRIHTQAVDLTATEDAHDCGDIRLAAGLALEGRVVDEQKNPIPHVNLAFASSQKERDLSKPMRARVFARLATDADGRFAVRGLEPGRYGILASPPGLIADPVEAEAGTHDVLIVARAGARWMGRILVEGQPVEGARVMARVPGKRYGMISSISARDGAVVLDPLWPDETFDLHVTHRGYRPFRLPGVTATTLPGEIALDPGSAIRGTVLDEGGEAIEGAIVRAEDAAGGPVHSARSDAKGIFAIRGLVPGKTYRVSVLWTRQRHAPGRGIEVAPDGEPLEFRLAEGRQIRGRVRGRDLEKRKSIRIVACDADGTERSSTWILPGTDVTFTLDSLPAGTFTLKAVTGWGDTEQTLAQRDGVAAGATGVELDLDG